MLEGLDELTAGAEALRSDNERLRADVEGLQCERSRLEGELSEVRLEQAALIETNKSLNNGNARLGERLAVMENELTAAKNELTAAKAELEERADTESQIRQFDDFIGRVEQMKETYERRISSLRAMIKALKTTTGQTVCDSDELAVINMDQPAPASPSSSASQVSPPTTQPPLGPTTESEAEWLETLPS